MHNTKSSGFNRDNSGSTHKQKITLHGSKIQKQITMIHNYIVYNTLVFISWTDEEYWKVDLTLASKLIRLIWILT